MIMLSKIVVHYVTNKILPWDSNSIVDVVMWSKFGCSSISKREVIITLFLEGFDQKKHFFREVVHSTWWKYSTS